MKLAELKSGMDDRTKVLTWLNSLNCSQDEIDEVMEWCKKSKEHRVYYVGRYDYAFGAVHITK